MFLKVRLLKLLSMQASFVLLFHGRACWGQRRVTMQAIETLQTPAGKLTLVGSTASTPSGSEISFEPEIKKSDLAVHETEVCVPSFACCKHAQPCGVLPGARSTIRRMSTPLAPRGWRVKGVTSHPAPSCNCAVIYIGHSVTPNSTVIRIGHSVNPLYPKPYDHGWWCSVLV